MGRTAVVEHYGRAREQPARQVVPHHPAGGGVPEEDIIRPEILMEGEHLEVLKHDPAVTVHDRLRQAGGARGVQHPQRVAKRNLGELGRPGRIARGQRVPAENAPAAARAGQAGAGRQRAKSFRTRNS